MAVTEWKLSHHRIRLEHSWVWGHATLSIDDAAVFIRDRNLFDFGFAHRFEIDGTSCAVIVQSEGLGFRYEFLTGNAAASIEESNRMPAAIENPVLTGIVVGVITGFVVVFIMRIL